MFQIKLVISSSLSEQILRQIMAKNKEKELTKMKYYEVAEITLNLNSKGYEMGDEESSYMGPDYKKSHLCER